MHSQLLKWVYVPSRITQRHVLYKVMSELCMAAVLLPGGVYGWLAMTVLQWMGRPWKPMFGGG